MLMPVNIRGQGGMSLIEIMIVVVLLAIVAALGVPAYNEMIQNSRIRMAAEGIQSGLQIARAEAIKRNALVKFELGDTGTWKVCQIDSPVDVCSPPYIQQRVDSEGSTGNITVAVTPAGNMEAIFDGFGMVAKDTNRFEEIDVDIDESVLSSDDSRELRIILGAGGSTRMCDPSPKLAETDPRAC